MEDRFAETFTQYQSQRKKILLLSADKYNEIVVKIQEFSEGNDKKKKSCDDVNLLNRFSLRYAQDQANLYSHGSGQNNQPKRVVKKEELFNLLMDTHKRLGHAGRDIMWKELRDYHGISKEIIEIFVKFCDECELKKGIPKKGIVIKPIVTKEQNERCQIDLVDLQSVPDGDYKFLMIYQDHLTKFVILRALKSKTAFEVVNHLMQVFGTRFELLLEPSL